MQEISKIVLERLQKDSMEEAHPDANLLTAFAERGLAEAERARVVEHLAHCDDCRETIALALPALEEAGAKAGVIAGRRNWFGWPALRWGLAAVSLAAVASVGVVQFEHRQAKDGALSFEVARNEPASSSAQTGELSIGVPEHATGAAMKKPAAESSIETFAASRKSAFEKKPIAEKVPPKARQWEVPAALPRTRVEEESGTLARNQIADQLVRKSAASPDVVKAKNPAPAENPAAIAGPNVPLQTEPAMMVRALPRWSISAGGGLQRSFDAGRSWENVNVAGPGVDNLPQPASNNGGEAQRETNAGAVPVFLAVAAIGPEVWAGGASGVLYHSADSGTRWTRVSPSSGDAVLAGDITGIQFSDAQHGAITTLAGEVWLTTDGGESWTRQQ